MNRHLSRSIIILAVATVLASCNRHTIYSHYEPVSTDGWDSRNVVSILTDKFLEADNIQEQLNLRLTDRYPYQNITVVVRQCLLPGGVTRQDTLQLQLTDDNGHSSGKGNYHRTYSFPICCLSVDKGQRLDIKVRHLMHQQQLPGITNVGITLKRKAE